MFKTGWISSRLTLAGLALLTAGISPAVSAANSLSPVFDAEFSIRVMGFNVGTATQKLTCQASNCTLETRAVPDRWARRLANEETHEKIQLRLHDQGQLQWLSYQKTMQRYRGNTTPQTTQFLWDEAQDLITNPDRDLTWPASIDAFDMISIIYALRQQLRAGIVNTNLLLQEDRRQTRIHFIQANQQKSVHTQFRSNLNARYYEWASEDVQVKLWLLDDYAFFPGRIELTHHDSGRNVILSLRSAPTF